MKGKAGRVGRSAAEHVKTSRAVAEAVQVLKSALQAKYGADFSFVVLGRGHLVAASNNEFGVIEPVVTESGE